ncbi:MAG: helix-turn-helix transcriptional regulator [Henriciella sp.]|nr:helix-turn-helix transcriptional regulator [Henriciella sp.]
MTNRHPFYLKQWRLHRGLSQQQLADRLESSKGYISDLERGVRRYNQDLLEALAYALMCEPADLLMRDPTKEDAIWSIWESVPETDRPKVIEMIKVFSGKKTGT